MKTLRSYSGSQLYCSCEKRLRKIFFGIACIAVLLLLFSFIPCDLANQAAIAAAYGFRATTDVNAGDVVVWDSTTPYGVQTTNEEAGENVAGVAAEAVTAGSDCTIRQDGGRVTVNVAGTVTKGQWLITSATSGKAKGVDAKQAGMFARAIVDSGTPAGGQVYASLNLGLLDYGTGEGGSSEGEANTASNLGSGIGVYEQKAGVDLQFNSLAPGSSKVSIYEDDPGNEIEIDVVESDIVHQNLNGAGTSSHADIDNHVASTSNPHSVTPSQIGAVDKSGDTLTGPLTLAGDPSENLHAASKQYVDNVSDTDIKQVRNAIGTVSRPYELEFSGTEFRLSESGSGSSKEAEVMFGKTPYGEDSSGTRCIYVDASTGDDGNPGTSSEPVQTIAAAWALLPSVLKESAKVKLATGTYREMVTCQGVNMGSSDAGITIEGTLSNQDSGTATGGTSTALTDTSKSWGINAFQGKLLRITGGTGTGQERIILSNTANTLTIEKFETAPDNTSQYSIDDWATRVTGADAGAETTPVRQHCMYVMNQRNVTLQYVEIDYTTDYAVKIESSTDINVVGCEIHHSNKHGIFYGMGSTSEFLAGVENCYIHDNGGSGVSAQWASVVHVLDIRTKGNSQRGLHSATGAQMLAWRCTVESNTKEGVYIDSGGLVLFSGGEKCSIKNNGDWGVEAANGGQGISASTQTYSGNTSGTYTPSTALSGGNS